jgi:hypothetical protein
MICAFLGAIPDVNRFNPYPLHMAWLSLPLLIAVVFWKMRPRNECRDTWFSQVLAYGYIISAVAGLLYVLIYHYYGGDVVTMYEAVEFANGTVCSQYNTNPRTTYLHRANDSRLNTSHGYLREVGFVRDKRCFQVL